MKPVYTGMSSWINLTLGLPSIIRSPLFNQDCAHRVTRACVLYRIYCMYGGGGDGFLDSSIVNSSRECKLAGRPSMFYSISIENTRISFNLGSFVCYYCCYYRYCCYYYPSISAKLFHSVLKRSFRIFIIHSAQQLFLPPFRSRFDAIGYSKFKWDSSELFISIEEGREEAWVYWILLVGMSVDFSGQ